MNILKTIAYGLLLSTIAVTAACGGNGANEDTNDLVEKIDLLQKKITELESAKPEPAPLPAAKDSTTTTEEAAVQKPVTLADLSGKWNAVSWVITDTEKGKTLSMDYLGNGYQAVLEIQPGKPAALTVQEPDGTASTDETDLQIFTDGTFLAMEMVTPCPLILSGDTMAWKGCLFDDPEITDIVWKRAQ